MNSQSPVVATPTTYNAQSTTYLPTNTVSSTNYNQGENTSNNLGSGMGWGLAIIIIIIIIIIILAIAWSGNNNNDNKSNKPKYCPRPRPKRGNNSDMDDPPNPEPSKAAVALLGLTGGDAASTKLDRDIATVLEVYNAERSPDSRIIIRDTQSDIARAAALWEEALNEGHRRFIGGNSSNELAALKPAINSRPDSLFVSVASTAPSLAERDNIFRLIKDDTQMVPAVPQFLANRYKYIHILQETGSIWADELSTLMQEALRKEGIEVGVTMVTDSKDISTNNLPINGQSSHNERLRRRSLLPNAKRRLKGYNNVCRTYQELDDNLSNIIPDEGDIAFLDIISSATAQHIFEQIDDSVWSQYKHYGFDAIITAPFTGKAASAANKTNLQVLSYWPQGTLESEAVLRRAGIDNINPLAISVYDAIVSLEQAGNDPRQLENYYNSNRGVTGLLTVNPTNDRITNPYVIWNYNNGNWEPSVVFGKAIPYGDFLGRFGTLEELENNGNQGDNDAPYDDYSTRDDCPTRYDSSPYSCDSSPYNSSRYDCSPYSSGRYNDSSPYYSGRYNDSSPYYSGRYDYSPYNSGRYNDSSPYYDYEYSPYNDNYN